MHIPHDHKDIDHIDDNEYEDCNDWEAIDMEIQQSMKEKRASQADLSNDL
jgi:hypothetical protein